MKNASSWGWIGLIAVVALIGAGFLYQRDGGRLFGPERQAIVPVNGEPKQTVLNEPKAVPKPSPQSSTLIVSVAFDHQECGPWLYLNQKLHKDYSGRKREYLQIADSIADEKQRWGEAALQMQKKYPGESFTYVNHASNLSPIGIKETIALPPGDYHVEFVSSGFNPSDKTETYGGKETLRFPLSFRKIKATLESGQEVMATFDPLPYRIAHLPAPRGGFTDGYGQVRILGPTDFDKDHLNACRKLIKENWERYQREPVRPALEKVQNDSPKGRAVMTQLPEAFGGARELTCPQIELITDWLKDVYSPILEIGPRRSRDPNDPGFVFWGNLNPLKREALQLMEEVDLKREEIDQLKAICRKLLQAGP